MQGSCCAQPSAPSRRLRRVPRRCLTKTSLIKKSLLPSTMRGWIRAAPCSFRSLDWQPYRKLENASSPIMASALNVTFYDVFQIKSGLFQCLAKVED